MASDLRTLARRVRRSSVAVFIGAWLAAVALSYEWSWLSHPELLATEPAALVYRVGIASGVAFVAFFWVAKLDRRVRRLERALADSLTSKEPTP